jgi:hypothetical protein
MCLDSVDSVAVNGHERRNRPLRGGISGGISPHRRARLAAEERDGVFLLDGDTDIPQRREVGNLWSRMLPARLPGGGVERVESMRSLDIEIGYMLM